MRNPQTDHGFTIPEVTIAMALTLTVIGGALFLTSDALILLGQANKWQPAAAGIWIMTLYILALLLLTVGVLGRSKTPNRPLAQRL